MQNQVNKPFNQKTFTIGIATAIGGVIVGLFGLIVLSLKVRLAVLFLGARTLFDMPFDSTDSMKIGIVALLAISVCLSGFVLFVGGTALSLIQLSRKSNT